MDQDKTHCTPAGEIEVKAWIWEEVRHLATKPLILLSSLGHLALSILLSWISLKLNVALGKGLSASSLLDEAVYGYVLQTTFLYLFISSCRNVGLRLWRDLWDFSVKKLLLSLQRKWDRQMVNTNPGFYLHICKEHARVVGKAPQISSFLMSFVDNNVQILGNILTLGLTLWTQSTNLSILLPIGLLLGSLVGVFRWIVFPYLLKLGERRKELTKQRDGFFTEISDFKQVEVPRAETQAKRMLQVAKAHQKNQES